jgi:hypothetical protein
LFGGRTQVGEGIAELFAAAVVVNVVGREFYGPVTGGDAQKEPTVGKLIHAGSDLGSVEGMPQWQHHACGTQGDAISECGKISEVGPGIKNLSRVAERRVKKRHFAHPWRGETSALGLLNQLNMVANCWDGAIEAF